MSAIAALKGYRTQFLYSLHFILSNLNSNQIFRLEGEEDLDVLDTDHKLICAIQLKNLGHTITLSDLLSDKKTSFIKRFLDHYIEATPILVSYGEISQDLKSWQQNKDTISEKEKNTLKKYKISSESWKLVKSKVQFLEVSEETIAKEVQGMIKTNFQLVDPVPTVGFLLNWLQVLAEKQQPITTKSFFSIVEDFGLYLSERIALEEQYGIILNPLHKTSTEDSDSSRLEKEFYNATSTKYEHVLLGLEVNRESYLEQIHSKLKESNTVIVKGASGQGKTTLIYSYVHNYINESLAFELNVQQDPITTQKSIQAIASICKKLDVPVVFVINVIPNNTSWLDVIKKSAHHNHIQFLVAIRNEDWYRATGIGVEFEHQDIDLVLSKQEAEMIYSRLNKINQIKHFTDFEEVWIQLGDNAPLLELVYSLTQGESLYNKLKQQVQQILKEGGLTNNPQIDFLRTVSLADAFGAKIDVSRLDANIDYQFIIEKLENEYLIKVSTDKKRVEGLHIVRSQKLVEILFDEFSSRKENYGYKCIPIIAEEDLYLFLIQLFHLNVFDSERFMSNLNKIQVSNWSIYSSIIKSLIWVGAREYVKVNRVVIDECREIVGEAWIMFIDFMFSSNFNRKEMLDLMKFDKEVEKSLEIINQKASSKLTIFNFSSAAINKLNFPDSTPISSYEWRSFGEALFWFKNIEHEKEEIPGFSEKEFESAFRKVDIKSLSKLMLGMYSHSTKLDDIRKKYQSIFIDRIKLEFDIIHFSIKEDEIFVHYIIDALEKDSKRFTNDFAVNILEILRTSFPDKKKFNSQGYGHRLQTLSTEFDETHKTMPIENLPLEEWININACVRKLYEYESRPIDWEEYRIKLNDWEMTLNKKIEEFNQSFAQLFKGSETYSPVMPVIQNTSYKYPDQIREPQSITDPLGIYGGKKQKSDSEDKKEIQSDKLQSKYEQFFKDLRDFRRDIDNFITQSAQTLVSRIKLQTEEGHEHNENLERLSQINLFKAIKELNKYNSQYQITFGNVDSNHSTKIKINNLLVAATFWKDFLNNNMKGEHTSARVLKLRTDFENKIIKDFKFASKKSNFSIKYFNSELTENKALIIIDGETPFDGLMGLKEAYTIVQNAIDKADYTSLKYLILQNDFPEFYFVQTVQNKMLSQQWHKISLYTMRDELVDDLSIISSNPQPCNQRILDNLNIQNWSQLFPEFNQINETLEAYGKLVLLVDHYSDLNFDKIELDPADEDRFHQYIERVSVEIQQSFKVILDSFMLWIKMFPLNKEEYLESEFEQEYFKSLLSINEVFFHQENEDYQITITRENVSDWIEKLKTCTESWNIFSILLYGKYINKYT